MNQMERMVAWSEWHNVGTGAQAAFTLLALLAGIFSAKYWFDSANVNLPPHTGDSWAGKGPFMDALLKQSVLSRKAALAALLAVTSQQFALIFSYAVQWLDLHLPHSN